MWNRRSGFLVGTISYIREALLASHCGKRLLVYACTTLCCRHREP